MERKVGWGSESWPARGWGLPGVGMVLSPIPVSP